METVPTNGLDTGQCPLCGQSNDCQLCTVHAYKGRCWCMKVEVPDALLRRLPPDLKNRACICSKCIENFVAEEFRPMNGSEIKISSPCIQVCQLDDEGICTGCQRTRGEIARWMQMNENERRQIMATLASRGRLRGQKICDG